MVSAKNTEEKVLSKLSKIQIFMYTVCLNCKNPSLDLWTNQQWNPTLSCLLVSCLLTDWSSSCSSCTVWFNPAVIFSLRSISSWNGKKIAQGQHQITHNAKHQIGFLFRYQFPLSVFLRVTWLEASCKYWQDVCYILRVVYDI